MVKNELEFFTNDYYKIFKILQENQIEINGKTFSPLIQQEIATALHCSRPTVNKMMKELKKQGYIKSLMKGRIELTDKARQIIEILTMEVK